MAGNGGEAQLSDNSVDADNAQRTSRKRKRTAHACDNCRTRKTRCDGRAPCSTCTASDLACTHGMETVSKGKSDLVLAAVLRMERSLEQLDSKVVSFPFSFQGENADFLALQSACIPTSPSYMIRSPDRGPGQVASARASHSLSPSQTVAGHVDAGAPEPIFRAWLASVENASISRLHTSTTESILAWPHFDCYAELRSTDRHTSASIFELEQARSTVAVANASPMLPFTSGDEIESIIGSFQENINFWYPTLAKSHLDQITDKILGGALGNDCESCLALLVLALGCACDVTTSALGDNSEFDAVERPDGSRARSERAFRPYSHRQKMGGLYFDCAMSRLHFAYQEVSRPALQCLLYTAFYHGSAQRPLQAWSMINATATKCRVLLSYKPNATTSEDEECIRRIFWSCFVLESDYLAELSALPLSGISDMESSVQFPGNYHTHDSVTQEEQSALYFLACLSMRRLLNRVHHLLYSKDTGASLDDSRFPKMVAELDHQLEEWRLLLPPRFQFTLDRQPAANQHAGFLRQRYLTCRSVIYRPYLMRMLGAGRSVDQDIREKCEKCLDACIDHILNLRGFSHTVFMDTWICSLSMAAAMLILLAAHRVPSVKSSIRPEATMLGQHLMNLLTRWIQIPGNDPSPSTRQAIRWIEVADKLIKDEVSGESSAAPMPHLGIH